MPFKLGSDELLIIFGIAILLFGVGRIGKIGAEIGRGIRDFRAGLKDDEPEEGEGETETEKA